MDRDDALEAFFRPRSIAVVGASGREGNPFARPMQFLTGFGFAGEIYPVNPRYEELYGRRCYASLTDVPGPVDLALLLIPAEAAVEVIAECGRVGVKAVIVFASGFGESGEGGRALERRLIDAADAAGVRFLGPNCQGVIHAASNLVATFTAAGEAFTSDARPVAYVGQSGALGGSIFDIANQTGVPLSAWVSTGNQLDVDVTELADTLVDDDTIRVLLLYVESVRDGAAFRSMLRRARTAGTHVILLHAGRSAVGQQAVASHTGAMSMPGVALDLLARQEGAILVADVDELVTMGSVLARGVLPAGRGVGVVTTSGGGGTIVADYCEDLGLRIDPLGEATQARLAELVPDFGSVANPVDVTAQLANRGEHNFYDVCRDVAADDAVDVLLIIITMVTGEPARRRAEQIAKVFADVDKPVLLAWLASDDRTEAGRAVYRAAGIPVFRAIRPLLRTTQLLTQTLDAPVGDPVLPHLDVGEVRRLVDEFAAAGRAVLTEADGQRLLDVVGVPRPAGGLATSPERADELATELGGEVVLKLQASKLLHKTEHDAVVVGVPPAEVAGEYARLTAIADELGVEADGVLVQAMAPPGVELVVGVTASSSGLPPVLTVGAGGVLVELYRDIAQRVLPVDDAEVRRMLAQLTFWPVLAGYRGREGVDVDAVAAAVSRIAAAAEAAGLQEFEVNPLLAHGPGEGVTAVDCLVRLPEPRTVGAVR